MNTTDENRSNTAKEEESALLLQSELAEGLRQEVGLLPQFANEWAALLTRFLRLRLGAQQIYIAAPSKAARDAAIFRDFDGTNAASVMRRYNVSRTRLYEIVKEQRELARRAISPVSSLKTGQAGG